MYNYKKNNNAMLQSAMAESYECPYMPIKFQISSLLSWLGDNIGDRVLVLLSLLPLPKDSSSKVSLIAPSSIFQTLPSEGVVSTILLLHLISLRRS